ncbi:MAG TPA: ATP-binding protein [Planctomycetota bacterium]|nr:ATP-binding protein [Planctomycetota bacterium]
MDPVTNPFAPGAGSPPPELAGRDDLLEAARICVERTRIGRPARSLLLVGLRGVGKTVLLERMRQNAERSGIATLRLEAPEGRSLPSLLAPHLKVSLIGFSRTEKARHLAERALRGLASFAKAFSVKYRDLELGLGYEPEPGLADNGDLEQDLTALLVAVAEATRAAGSALAVFIDELQYVPEDQLAALITALHRCAQVPLPVTMIGAGLPQLRARTGKAKSYAERLFEFPAVGALNDTYATQAIERPLQEEGVAIEPEAVRDILSATQGYPYFLQEWCKHAWDVAAGSPITRLDVEVASRVAIAALDASFFRVRLDRLTPSERRYLRAMASLGPGPHRSGDIADALSRTVTSLAPTRAKLIDKGMVWSPAHGDTAFTVPLFDEFMMRAAVPE